MHGDFLPRKRQEKKVTSVEKTLSPSRWSRLTLTLISYIGNDRSSLGNSQILLIWCDEVTLCLWSFLIRIIRKSDKSQLRDILQNTQSIILKTGKLINNKTEKLSQLKFASGDMTTHYNVLSWIGFSTRKRTLGENWGSMTKL